VLDGAQRLGAVWSDLWPLLILGAIAIPAGLVVFRAGERYAKRHGKLKRRRVGRMALASLGCDESERTEPEGGLHGRVPRTRRRLNRADALHRVRRCERSRRFYTDVLGGETVLEGEPSIVALANGWIIINVGGGPTDDKPTVILEAPSDRDRASSFLNIRVADIEAVYADWSARGAEFLTPNTRWTAGVISAATSATRTGT